MKLLVKVPNALIVRPRYDTARLDAAIANIRDNPKFGLGLTPANLMAPPHLQPRECIIHAPEPRDEFDHFFICARKNRPAAALWEGLNTGNLLFTGNVIQVTDDVFRSQYYNRPEIEIDIPMTAYRCPWCGVTSEGLVLCGSCHREVARCRTIGDFFRCAPGCRGEGKLHSASFKKRGYVPGL
jgi:hypothetical protein